MSDSWFSLNHHPKEIFPLLSYSPEGEGRGGNLRKKPSIEKS